MKSLQMKRLIIKILAWVTYTLVSLGLWFIGNLILMFGVYDMWVDSSDAEWERYEQGELIYTVIAIALFIGGSIILHLYLNKKLKGRLNTVLHFLNWDR